MSADLDGNVVEASLLDRAERHAQSWRRIAFVAMLVTVLAIGLVGVVVTRQHTEAIVYKENGPDLALMGRAYGEALPSAAAVKHQLALWISDYRLISNDPSQLNSAIAQLLTMTGKGSLAYNDVVNRLTQVEKPDVLARRGLLRSVTNVDVTRLSTLVYRISWAETLRQKDGAPITYQLSGNVTLAGEPKIPTDAAIGLQNPAGVIVSSDDLGLPPAPQ